MARTWNMWASRRPDGTLWYVGSKFFNKNHGSSFPTVEVVVTETEEDAATHFGFEYTDKPGHVTMIFPRAKQSNPMMLLDMCFAYGMKVAVDHGEGKPVPLLIIESPHAPNQ